MLTFSVSKRLQSLNISSTTLRLYHVGRAANVNTAIAKGIRKSNGIGFRGKEHAKPSESDPRQRYRERNGIGEGSASIINHSDGILGPRSKRDYRQSVEDTRDFSRSKSAGPRSGGFSDNFRRSGDSAGGSGRDGGSFGRGGRGGRGGESGRPSYGRGGAGGDSRPSFGRGGGRDSRPSFGREDGGDSRPSFGGGRGRGVGENIRPSFARGGGDSRPSFGRGARGDSRPSFGRGRGDSPPSFGRSEGDSRPSGSTRGGRGSDFGSRGRGGRSGISQRESGSRDLVEDRYPSLSKKPSFASSGGSYQPRERSHSTAGRFSSSGDSRQSASSRFEGSGDRSAGKSWSEHKGKTFDAKPPFELWKDRDDEAGTDINKHDSTSTSSSSTKGHPDESSRDSSNQVHVTKIVDNRIPLSIPYTTPASEFLYGASVVEAALTSRRSPSRQLYKLYIYNGQNREKGEDDANIEKLAKKNGVSVSKVGIEWSRLLDKMSGGRPHNGYILEASPLPRLPITSLGRLLEKDGIDGFEVDIDHQSKEEAAVNGTETFIKIPKGSNGRKPLILLLDSIQDPGNLGGIIRTASFLGATAVAISARNSAPFSPVVLKASAGASENITIFSVNKPSGFIVDSQAAGWKVYAAVAPSKRKDPDMPMSISTNQLKDPLMDDPCILMLGSEGEGLRWNLRSKADADLYVAGSGYSRGVDSLNVSVATGILCDAFLRRRIGKIEEEVVAVEDTPARAEVEKPKGDLF